MKIGGPARLVTIGATEINPGASTPRSRPLARPTTVGAENKTPTGSVLPKAFRISNISRMPRSEWPPRSKKLS
jgi:hypothetical protein